MRVSNSLRYKLILFTSSFILITLVVVAIAIDIMLSDLYDERASHEAANAYENVYNSIRDIEVGIAKRSHLISEDDLVIARVSLINRYQDISDYQSLIFDEEKKKIGAYLFNQIGATQNEIASVYGEKGELVAFSIHNDNQHLIGIVSYRDGHPIYLASTNGSEWLSMALPDEISPELPPVNGLDTFVLLSGNINYFSNENNFTIEHSRLIQRSYPDGASSSIGIVKILRPIDNSFISQMSERTNVHVSLLLDNGNVLNDIHQLLPAVDLERNSGLFGSTVIRGALWIEHEIYYLQSYIMLAENGKVFLLFSAPKSALNSALNNARLILFFVFVSTGLLAIIFASRWLNTLITKPIDALTHRAEEIKKGNYPVFPVAKSSSDLELLGRVLNKMVDSIRSREKELNKSQNKLKEAQRLAKIGSWEIDYIEGTMEWSEELYEIFEVDPQLITPSYENYLEKIPSEERDDVTKIISEVKENNRPGDISHTLTAKDGTFKYVHQRIVVQCDEAGNPLLLYGTIQDVTEQKQKDEILRRTQKMDALGKLTGGIAHDFNNMLGVILGYSELLQRKLTDEPNLAKYASQITHAGERAKVLTQKLLTISRKEASTNRPTDINVLLKSEQNMLQKTLTPRIELIYQLSDNVWPVNIDKGALEDAILNMAINAIHAIDNSGRFTISTSNIHLSVLDATNMDIPVGDYMLLSISDTGKGMSEATRNQLFDPFFSTKGDEGTGLGMAQVYAFVQQSNGAIHVYSELGHGTQIIIYLPRLLISTPIKSIEEEDEVDAELYGLEVILVVDDEEPLRELALEILSSFGYKVLSAENGSKALDILKTESVDLLLSDVIMPNMDGYQLADKVRELYPDIKIQMASGFNDKRLTDRADAELFQKQLHKPYTSAALLKRVRELLDERSNPQNSGDSLNLLAQQQPVVIEWSDDIATGIGVVDSDHKQLVSLLNRCQQAISEGDEKVQIKGIIDELLDYTSYHFRREEFVMELCKFPDLSNHQHMHNLLVNQVHVKIKEYESGKLTAISLLDFLSNWLKNHIIGMDKAIIPFCKGKEHELEQALIDAGLNNISRKSQSGRD